jgi:SNF2 family DNA or RNA helicase
LKDLAEELQGQPLLIAYEFQHEIERIKVALATAVGGSPEDIPHVGQGVTPKKTDRIIKSWNRGELPFLLAHPASLGHGVNLQESANHVCYYGLTWDLELYDQFMRRVYRQGVKGRVFVYQIIANDTIDETVLGVLMRKNRVQRTLLEALETRRRKKK